ncbi:MAG: phosphatase PAP2 family protein [Planctomycetes bacterium]|nr:phosphatase PAP2 family protein [Planctomycetota bacterium]
MEQSTARTARFYLTHGALPLALAVAAVLGLEHSGFDTWAADACFDPALGNFPWRKHWLTEDLIHKAGKNAAIGVGLVAIALLVASRWKRGLVSWRRPLAYFVACMALGPLAASAWKDASSKRCPWDLVVYGGFAQADVILESDPPEHRRGCFPCGQASAGFALASGYFALRGRAPRWSKRALWIGLAYGTLLGFGRVLQGAHYPSHVVATAGVCWSVALVLYEVALRRRDDQRRALALASSAAGWRASERVV